MFNCLPLPALIYLMGHFVITKPKLPFYDYQREYYQVLQNVKEYYTNLYSFISSIREKSALKIEKK